MLQRRRPLQSLLAVVAAVELSWGPGHASEASVIATPLSSWDAGLQSPKWRQQQQRAFFLDDVAAARGAKHYYHSPAGDPKVKPASARDTVRASATGVLQPCDIIVTTPPLPTPLPQELQTMVAQVEQGLDQMFNGSGATGGVGILVYGDQVLTTHGYGTMRAGQGKLPTGDSIFRIGSISKVFTDLMLFRLDEDEDENIHLSTPITQLAPEFR
jgi:CubicO group peptidase (beta-lactamase class C family)